ncbi:MAG: hypothetical protein ACOCY0_00595 [Roseicyclus sp.]
MIGGFLAALAGSAWARTALRYGVTAFAILLFLLALRRSGERAARPWRKPMTRNDGCSRRRRVVLVLATIWLGGCATVGSDVGGHGA